jgi:hypothetical protein
VSAVTPTTLRQKCIMGTVVRSETPRTRVRPSKKITPTMPR